MKSLKKRINRNNFCGVGKKWEFFICDFLKKIVDHTMYGYSVLWSIKISRIHAATKEFLKVEIVGQTRLGLHFMSSLKFPKLMLVRWKKQDNKTERGKQHNCIQGFPTPPSRHWTVRKLFALKDLQKKSYLVHDKQTQT